MKAGPFKDCRDLKESSSNETYVPSEDETLTITTMHSEAKDNETLTETGERKSDTPEVEEQAKPGEEADPRKTANAEEKEKVETYTEPSDSETSERNTCKEENAENSGGVGKT